MRDDLVRATERLTECTVEALISGNHIAADLSAELSVLDRSVPGDPVDVSAT
jgi:hypothetical protein